jgi:hypothetical protein
MEKDNTPDADRQSGHQPPVRPSPERQGACNGVDDGPSTGSRWHDEARKLIAEMIAEARRDNKPATKKKLMAERHPRFQSGYLKAVWECEVDRALATRRTAAELRWSPLIVAWPMTDAQRKFLSE